MGQMMRSVLLTFRVSAPDCFPPIRWDFLTSRPECWEWHSVSEMTHCGILATLMRESPTFSSK